MGFLRIVLLSVALAILYGIAHDLVTAHVCVEYFTIGHPRVIDSTAPVDLALTWGVLATWWMGLGLGLILGLACRVGRRPRIDWLGVLRPALVLLATMAVLAAAGGLLGGWFAARGEVRLLGRLAERVPADRHVAFLGCLWAHLTSFAAGALGGIVLAVVLWRRRGRAARGAARVALLLCCALPLGGCLESKETIRIEQDGSGRFVQRVSIDPQARDELLRRLARLHGAEKDPETLPLAEPFSPAWVRTCAEDAPGYVIEKVERTVGEDGRLTTQVVARFDQLAEAARGGAFFTAGVRLDRVGKRRWRLVVSDVWAAPLREPDGELAGRPARDLVEVVREPLVGYRVERTFALPGKVLETNGTLGADGRSVSFVVDHAQVMAAKDLVLEIVFEADEEATFLGVSYEPDPEALMLRALEAPPGVPERR